MEKFRTTAVAWLTVFGTVAQAVIAALNGATGQSTLVTVLLAISAALTAIVGIISHNQVQRVGQQALERIPPRRSASG